MNLSKLKIGKKYRIKTQEGTVNAKLVANNKTKKLLKLEIKNDVYECKYSEIKKIQSLTAFRTKWAGLILLVLLLFYRIPNLFMNRFGICGEYKNWDCEGMVCGCYEYGVALKPIVYLYPETTTNVSVMLGHPENITHTYPKYNKGWNVQAEPNGDLTDIKTGRHYYALYWEGKNTNATKQPNTGFVVKGKNTISFLEEKLNQLGLSEREAQEFIVYWLPKLESAPYNFIRFQTIDEQNTNMPLIVEPAPQTVIRVMMEYSNLDAPIDVPEQSLPSKPEHNGFTVVEWGGTKIDL